VNRTLNRGDLDPERARGLTTQSYAKKPSIEGMRLVELRRFTEDAGSFAELLRLSGGQPDGIDGFDVKQVNYSDLEPGAIKAWHLHLQQEDLWVVPPVSKLLVGLVDMRKASPTCGVSQRFVLGDGRAQLLLIPRGVAHGAANVTPHRQVLMYFVNQQFSAAEPDEHRLDPFLLGREFWEMQAG
jgi:dTDP-4-dehydrorhamnose 3,5-epimerase